ncbi:MAG: 7-carboxy-7-deazaguanine synthase QueE [Chlamydiales bacterium]
MNLNDVFWTFQGEGFFAGTRALFVRMPYCNLACSWCDTTFNTFTKWSDKEFRDFASQESSRFAVITGGEPMMNKHTPEVVRILKGLGFYIACETNGNFPIVEGIHWVTCSPKRDSNPPYHVDDDLWQKVSEFKYVVDEGFDLSILDRHDPGIGVRLSLSPEFNNKEKSLPVIYDYIKKHPNWKISLQTHKWMNIP